MSFTYTYLLIFGCIAYFIVIDESIANAVVLTTEIVKIRLLMLRWWLVNNPKTPWARYSIYRRSMKLAKELMKEYNEK
jgi:hypothetical protein